jgi:metacaspase-1
MARGVSLHIGLNEVSPDHYRDSDGNPWNGRLYACENDARVMAELAEAQGFEVRGPLLTAEATAAAVLDDLRAAARDLAPGDTFFLTYSGHGGQVENTNPEDDPEDDALDETWCLYDRQLLDDELFAAYSEFAAGVKVVVFSDSCHSGTVARGDPPSSDDDARPKQLPIDVALATEKANVAMYSTLQKDIPTKRLTRLDATVVLLSGCKDDQFSRDGRVNGAFTAALLEAWNDPDARRSLPRLLETLSARIPPSYNQVPNHSVYCFDVGPALAI